MICLFWSKLERAEVSRGFKKMCIYFCLVSCMSYANQKVIGTIRDYG